MGPVLESEMQTPVQKLPNWNFGPLRCAVCSETYAKTIFQFIFIYQQKFQCEFLGLKISGQKLPMTKLFLL